MLPASNSRLMDIILYEIDKIDNGFRFLANGEVIDCKKAVDSLLRQSF